MTETGPKQTLLEIDNVRIREHDSYNLAVERYETIFNPITKEERKDWAFKGYTSSILSGTILIINKDLLIDRNSQTDAESLLKKMQESERKILDAVERLYHE